MEITFRNATDNDIDKIFELNKKLIEDYETTLNLNFQKIFTWIERKIQNNIKNYQCIYFDGIKAGYYYLHDGGKSLNLMIFLFFKNFKGEALEQRF